MEHRLFFDIVKRRFNRWSGQICRWSDFADPGMIAAQLYWASNRIGSWPGSRKKALISSFLFWSGTCHKLRHLRTLFLLPPSVLRAKETKHQNPFPCFLLRQNRETREMKMEMGRWWLLLTGSARYAARLSSLLLPFFFLLSIFFGKISGCG